MSQSLPKILKHFKLSPQELIKLLAKHDIQANLKTVSKVPELWLKVLEIETGITPPETTKITRQDSTNQPNQKTYSNFNQLTAESTHPISQGTFTGFVHFIASDYSHAYVSPISNLARTSLYSLNGKKGEYVSNPLSSVSKHQFVVCSRDRRGQLNIMNDAFKGIVRYKPNEFLDLENQDNSNSLSSRLLLDSSITKTVIAEVFLSAIDPQIKVTIKKQVEADTAKNLLDRALKLELRQTPIGHKLKPLIAVYEELYGNESARELLLKQFKLEKNEGELENEDALEAFLRKWTVLRKSLLCYKNIQLKQHRLLFFKKWLAMELPSFFFRDRLAEQLKRLATSSNNTYQPKDIVKPFKTSLEHITELRNELKKFLNSSDKELTDKNEYLLFRGLIDEVFGVEKESLKFELENQCSSGLKLVLYKEGLIHTMPLEHAKEHFHELSEEQQLSVLNKVEDHELLPLAKHIKASLVREIGDRVYKSLAQHVSNAISAISFDLEADQNSIWEIAWTNGKEEFNYLKEEVSQGLKEFQTVLDSGHLIIGHNIKAWDLKRLRESGIFNDSIRIWDTLEVEALLSPEFDTYALNTAHHALDDAKHTMALFVNQAIRIISLSAKEQEWHSEILDQSILNQLYPLKEHIGQAFLANSGMAEKKLGFFRSQPKPSPFVYDLEAALSKSIAAINYVLAPNLIVPELLATGKLDFAHDSTTYDFDLLSVDKVHQKLHDEPWLRASLLSYINFCSQNDRQPYWGSVSSFIRLKTSDVIDILELVNFKEVVEYDKPGTYFISTTALCIDESLTKKRGCLFVIFPELIAITERIKLQELDLQNVKNAFQESKMWVHFSGGQSSVFLSAENISKLGLEFPTVANNAWIEKYKYGKYIVWYNTEWEKKLTKNNFSEIVQISKHIQSSDRFPLGVKISSHDKGYNLVGLNPETIYRASYWALQKEVISNLGYFNKSKVLFIQREEEIDSLDSYFRNSGYYVPDKNAGLARRLELLHKNTSPKKIIIASLGSLLHVLKANVSEALDVFVDSIDLTKSYFTALGSSFYNSRLKETKSFINNSLSVDSEDDPEEEELLSGFSRNLPEKDVFFKLKLAQPYLDYLWSVIQANNKENTLWLLDPRITDHEDYAKALSILPRQVKVWENKESFYKEIKRAEKFLPGPSVLEVPYSSKEISEMIRSLFLPAYNWRENQAAYLELIIPGEKDVLIQMPTGVGKSVLFQGPAIFKSSFSNRLSLVITPLKALMEDQVMSLWQRGFHGAVEYLNADRRTDSRIIYRGIAGGEITLLYITPERFRSRSFLSALEMRLQTDGGLEYFIFDEAHCVSQWGHEFRPDYFNAVKEAKRIKLSASRKVPLLFFSATISKKIEQELNQMFE